LDFEPGASRTPPPGKKALVASLQACGFGPLEEHRLLAVLNGLRAPLLGGAGHLAGRIHLSAASCIRSAIFMATCSTVATPKLPACDDACGWPEEFAAGRATLSKLRISIAAHNAATVASLDESGDQLITLYSLNVPSTLHVSLLSAYAIKNVMRNYRSQTASVSRWGPATNQISRWTAIALLQIELFFNHIKGQDQIPKLLQSLALQSLTSEGGETNPSTPPRIL